MLKRICLLTNYNLYDSKRYFAEKFSESLKRVGVETKVIDTQETPIDAKVIDSIQDFDPDLTCSFNTILPTHENQYLWDVLELPHLYIHLDPALYAAHMTRSPYSIISCVDLFDCESLKSPEFQNVLFFPHAVEQELTYDESIDRPYDVVFLGSCYDYESLSELWKGDLTPDQIAVLEEAAHDVLTDNKAFLAQSLVKAWAAKNLDARGVDLITLFTYLDYYTRGKDRIDLIRSIKDVPVHVFGDTAPDISSCRRGWKDYLGEQSNVILHPPISFGETMDILRKAKICLNSMPFFKNGTHERVFYALGCGAFPVTTDNLWMRANFEVDQELLLYQNDSLGLVNDQIKALLKDEKKRKKGVESGREKVMQHHTWDMRVMQLQRDLPQMMNNIAVRNA